MELLRLRRRLLIAERGYKLLEDKLDELMRVFLKTFQETKKLQEEVDKASQDAFLSLLWARILMPKEDFLKVVRPSVELKINFTTLRLINLEIPSVMIEDISGTLDYDFTRTPLELDIAFLKFQNLIPKLIKLAQLHKICQMISFEIERTRRRSNALKYILIPSLKETIDYINDRLQELERANISRLMRIKEIIRAD